ncbi:hypothetical protein RB195_020076 [Necator americanus]|uniref:Uncharacterized protein n=1 Tax=Necator americanus TaxID=51031 RepID=A0ABR1CIJ1_NECAM
MRIILYLFLIAVSIFHLNAQQIEEDFPVPPRLDRHGIDTTKERITRDVRMREDIPLLVDPQPIYDSNEFSFIEHKHQPRIFTVR